LSDVNEILASVLLLIGAGFTLVGSIGLVRLPDFYTRMHAPTKATTVGVSCMLAAAALVLPGNGLATAAKAALVIIFLFLTAPIGAHMMARTARNGGIRPVPGTRDDLPPAPIERLGEGPAGR
jgi:multicomponent K+:H+ antiporter subunit G